MKLASCFSYRILFQLALESTHSEIFVAKHSMLIDCMKHMQLEMIASYFQLNNNQNTS